MHASTSQIMTASSIGTTTPQNTAILCRLRSGQLLSLDPDSPGGLIILKSFYADFAGPGAAVGSEFDRSCTAVYAIGAVRFRQAATRAERKQNLQTRIAYAETLAAITDTSVPLRRGCMIVEQLCQWLPTELAETIPAELVGKLVGVLPTTVKLAWQSRHRAGDETPTLLSFQPETRLVQSA